MSGENLTGGSSKWRKEQREEGEKLAASLKQECQKLEDEIFQERKKIENIIGQGYESVDEEMRDGITIRDIKKDGRGAKIEQLRGKIGELKQTLADKEGELNDVNGRIYSLRDEDQKV